MGLFDLYQKAKKKLSDTFSGVEDSAISAGKSLWQKAQDAGSSIKKDWNNDASGLGIAKNTAIDSGKGLLDVFTADRDPIPTFDTSKDNFSKTPYSTGAKNAWNFAASIPNTVIRKGVLAPANDFGTNLGRVASGQNVTPYKDLKSGASKIAYDLMGEGGRKPQDVLSDVAETANPVLSAWGGGKVTSLAKKGLADKSLGVLAKQGAVHGMRVGGASGVSQGLQEGKDKTLKEQLLGAGVSGAEGAVVGGGLGFATPYVGSLPTKAFKEGKNIISDLPNVKDIFKKRVIPGTVDSIPARTAKGEDVYALTKEGLKAPEGSRLVGKPTKWDNPMIENGSDFTQKTVQTLPAQSIRRTPDRVENVFNPRSATFQWIQSPKMGMSIEDVSKKPITGPTNKNTQAINAFNAEKNAKAAAMVSAMKGRVPQSPAKAPVVSIEDFVKNGGKTPPTRGLATSPLQGRKPEGVPFEGNPFKGESANPKTSQQILPIEDFVKNGGTPPQTSNIEKDLAKMKKDGTMQSMADIFKQKEYNPYQQKYWDKKKANAKAFEELGIPREVVVVYGKRAANKMSSGEAKIKAEMIRLGYPKEYIEGIDFEKMKEITDKGVPHYALMEYAKKKAALNTKFLKGVNPESLKDISPLQAGTRDVYRNFEDAFGENAPILKKNLLDPFDRAKGAMYSELEKLSGWLDENIVKGLGIKKGSKESAAVQRFGEGKMTIEEVKQQFPKTWEKILQADMWFREQYGKLLDDLNSVREANFPTHPLYPESTKIIPKRDNYYRHFQEMKNGFEGLKNIFESPASIDPALAVASADTKPKTKWLSFAQSRKGDATTEDAVGGFLDYLKAYGYAKHVDPFIQKFRGVDKEAANKARDFGEHFDETRVGLAEELSKKFDPISKIADSADPEEISAILQRNGMSAAQAEWMSKDLSQMDSNKKIIEYIRDKTRKNGDDILAKMVPKAEAESAQNKMNNFLVFLKNFTNDLAGKTNPIDRPFQENFVGRKMLRAMSWANSRIKANVILGNASSALAQFFSIPNGVANAGARNSLKAVGDSLAGIFAKNSPIQKSDFIRERYFDNSFSQFDSGILNNTKKFAVWLTGVGDQVGTRFVWNAQYRKALSEGVPDPVKYADDWTRKMVAGRGIGEVPIAQKSKVFQLVAPFQLEVANQWRVFSDWAKNDPSKLAMAKKLIEYSVATWMMNSAVKEIRGSDVAFDPIQAMIDATQSYQDAESPVQGSLMAGGRLAGEILSNLPGGQTLAGLYPEYGMKNEDGKQVLPTREKFFGKGDPTRFGGGGLFSKALLEPQYMLLPSYGGRQIKNTIDGVKTLVGGVAESSGGKVMTPVTPTVGNVIKGTLFGKGGISEVQDYRNNDGTPLSDQQSEKFRASGNDRAVFDSIMADRQANKEVEALKKGSPLPKGNENSFAQGTANASTDERIKTLSNGHFYVPSLASDMKEFKTQKQAEKAIRIEDFMGSEDKSMEMDGRFYYKDPSSDKEWGSQSVDERKKLISVANANLEMDRAKGNKDTKGWLENANKKLQATEEYIATLDPNFDQAKISEATLAKENLKDQIDKISAQGGFTKGTSSTTLNATKLENLKKKGDFNSWKSLVDTQYQAYMADANNPNLSENKRMQAENKAIALKSEAEKYAKWGGFKYIKQVDLVPFELALMRMRAGGNITGGKASIPTMRVPRRWSRSRTRTPGRIVSLR